MMQVSTHVKKIGKKAAAAGAAGIEPRNLAKVKMQEMTPEEIQASLSFPPPARGLGYICRERERECVCVWYFVAIPLGSALCVWVWRRETEREVDREVGERRRECDFLW